MLCPQNFFAVINITKHAKNGGRQYRYQIKYCNKCLLGPVFASQISVLLGMYRVCTIIYCYNLPYFTLSYFFLCHLV